MLKTVKAGINPQGKVKLLEPVKLAKEKNAILTILEDEIEESTDLKIISVNEKSLGEDWNSEADTRWDIKLRLKNKKSDKII